MIFSNIDNTFLLKHKKIVNLRAENVSSVLYTFFTHEYLSRNEIIQLTSLSPSTVSNITSDLMDRGIIKRVGNLGKSTPGRKSDLLSRNSKAFSVASVHFTPENIRLGIVDLGYNLVDSKNMCFPNNFEEKQTDNVIQELKSLIEKNSGLKNNSAIGLALPNYPFNNKRIISAFKTAFELPIVHINNVEAMAMCEYYFHLNKTLHTLVFVYVGTGIGSGVIINGNLYRGITGKACDLGHIYITDEPLICRCKRKGCLETVASEYSISQKLARHYNLDPPPVRDDLIQHLSDYIQKEDDFTLSLIKKAASYLGKGLFNLVSILDPQEVVITGRMNKLNPFFSNLVEKAYLDHARQSSFPIIPLRFIELREDAGLKGTAMFSFMSIFCEAEYMLPVRERKI